MATQIASNTGFHEDQDEEDHRSESPHFGEDRSRRKCGVEPAKDAIFSRFNDLPLEIRSMIWGMAASVPRIVHLDHVQLNYYRCWRVRSDRAINDFGENSRLPAFFDSECEIDNDEFDRLAEMDAIGPDGALFAFRTLCPIPSVLLVCRESFAVMSRFFTRAFGDLGAFPEIWVNFESDFIYMDWGDDGSGRRYEIEDIGDEDLERMQHVVLYESQDYIARLGYGSREERLAEVLSWLPNIETVVLSRFAPVHSAADTGDLNFKDPITIDSSAFLTDMDYGDANKNFRDREEDISSPESTFYAQNVLEYVHSDVDGRVDVDKLKKHELELLEYGIKFGAMPRFVTKIITTPKMRDELVDAEAAWKSYMLGYS